MLCAWEVCHIGILLGSLQALQRGRTAQGQEGRKDCQSQEALIACRLQFERASALEVLEDCVEEHLKAPERLIWLSMRFEGAMTAPVSRPHWKTCQGCYHVYYVVWRALLLFGPH